MDLLGAWDQWEERASPSWNSWNQLFETFNNINWVLLRKKEFRLECRATIHHLHIALVLQTYCCEYYYWSFFAKKNYYRFQAKFVRFNLKVLYLHDVCNYRLKNNILLLYVAVFMNYPRTTFNMPSPNGSLVFAIRLNTKENLRLATMFYLKFCKRSCLKTKASYSSKVNTIHNFRTRN